MGRVVIPDQDAAGLAEAVRALAGARSLLALTGAGISVASGIPDFRSPGGVWTIYDPDEYATIQAFHEHPAKAWVMYRAMYRELRGKRPNAAHRALARLEAAGRLAGVVTQNIDGLHQAAGSRTVWEVHGNVGHLQCLGCDSRHPVPETVLEDRAVPRCPRCGSPLKPDVVLFGEDVRETPAVGRAIARCDALLVIGTSATVFPAAGLPAEIAAHGGTIWEFNLQPTALTRGQVGRRGTRDARAAGVASDWLFQGPASVTVPLLVDALLGA